MKRNTTNWMITALAAGLLSLPLSAQSTVQMEALRTVAAQATTPVEHADVAKRYRLQSEAFAERAEQHEKNVKQGMRSLGAMARKWPGMTSNAVKKEKAKALEARRASQEAMALADHHLRLSVEAQADTPVAAD